MNHRSRPADMPKIKVCRPANPGPDYDYLGWVEPADHSWILFVGKDGKPQLFVRREPEEGAPPASPLGRRDA